MTATKPATMSVPDLAKSYVRTVIPVIVGLIVSLALRAGLDVHGYTPEITSAVTFAYYAAARALEHYLDPRFGWLLGIASRPLYAEAAKPARKRSTRPARDHGYGLIELLVRAAIALVALLLIIWLISVIVRHIH